MAGVYDTIHDVGAVIFSRNKPLPNEIKNTELTKQVKHDLIVAKEELSRRALHHAYNW